MSGALTSVDRPYIQLYSFAADEGGRIVREPGRHTVLDILSTLQESGATDMAACREQVLEVIDQKRDAIEISWQNVVRGYVAERSGPSR